MGVNNGIITAPINLRDPYTCMGVGATANRYDLGYICSNVHEKTDKWSKYKPLRFSSPQTETNPDWYRGDDGMCGLDITMTNNVDTVVQQILAGDVWAYLPPRPGTDWCRLTDFDGYDHNCVAPFYNPVNKSATVWSGSTIEQSLLLNSKATNNLRNLHPLSDIMLNGTLIQNWHYACVITSTSGTKVAGFCAPQTLAFEKSIVIPMTSTHFSETSPGTYYIVPLIISASVGSCNFAKGGSWPTSVYYATLPLSKATLTTYPRSYVNITIEAEYSYNSNGSRRGIIWSLYGTNKTDDNVSLGALTITVYSVDRLEDGERENKVYEYEEADGGAFIPPQSINWNTRYGGEIEGSQINNWNSESNYIIQVESSNELLGKVRLNVY